MAVVERGLGMNEFIYRSHNKEHVVQMNHGMVVVIVYQRMNGLSTFKISLINCRCCVSITT